MPKGPKMACPERGCDETQLQTTAEVARHYASVHNENCKLFCSICKLEFTTLNARLHFERCHPESIPKMLCSCGQGGEIPVCSRKGHWNKHLQDYHGIKVKAREDGITRVFPRKKL